MKCYFFGTFNPIHKGHIEIARQVKEKLGFQSVVFVPSYMPPHKATKEILSFSHRLKMVQLAVGEENTSDIEHRLKVPSYTYRTIEKLFEENDNQKVNFIIGYDQFFQIENWREPEILKEKIHFIVIPRKFQNGQVLSLKAFEYLKNKSYSFEILNIDFLDVSSNMIRKYIEENQDITGLVSYEVKNYIENNGLYSKMAVRKSV